MPAEVRRLRWLSILLLVTGVAACGPRWLGSVPTDSDSRIDGEPSQVDAGTVDAGTAERRADAQVGALADGSAASDSADRGPASDAATDAGSERVGEDASPGGSDAAGDGRQDASDAGDDAPPLLLRRIIGSAAVTTTDPSIPVRVVRGPCALAGRVAGPEVELWNDRLGAAGWDCDQGLFYMGPFSGAEIAVPRGRYQFHFTAPADYACDHYVIYGGTGDEVFSAAGQVCMLSFTVDETTAPEIFLWFFVKAPNWVPCQEDVACVSGVCGCNGGPAPAVCLPSELYPRDCSLNSEP